MKKLLILMLLFSCMSFWLNAQELLKHEKKVYLSPDNKIYVNKALPIYLRLSTSPDKKNGSILLKSESTPAYANPMYLDSEGYNTIRSPWAVDTVTKKTVYPKQDIVFEVYADSRPPSTTTEYSTGETFIKGGKTYTKGVVTITLKATDEASGVENIYYSLNGGSYNVYSTPISLQEEQEYALKYYAVDHVGNAETRKEKNIIIDLSPPITSLDITGDNFENVISGRSEIILKAEDKGMGVDKLFFRIDNGEWRNYRSPLAGHAVSQGEHTMDYYAVDLTGHQETTQTYTFYVDKTPPVMVQELIGKSFFSGGKEYASGRNQIKITTFDNKAGVKEVFYSINNTDYVRYEKPFYLSDVRGNLLLKAYALDNVGNRTESIETGESFTIPYVDLSGPSVLHSFTDPSFTMRDTVFISSKTGIVLKATDSESGVNRIEYAVDGSEQLPYSDAFQLDKEGVHRIQTTGYDNVENTSHTEFAIVLDNTGPSINTQFSIRPCNNTISEGKTLDVYPGHVVIFLSSTDDITGFDVMYYSLNGITEKKYTVPIGNFSAGGNYNLKIRALDKLGNESRKEIDFSVTF